MRHPLAAALLPILLAGCAVPTTVQRMGVGYNTAVANLTDQLTLLNVVRAHHGYPLHYTSLTRLSGSLTFKGSAGIGSQFNLKGHDNKLTTTSTTANSDIGTELAKEVTSAGHQFTPSLAAEVDSNPSFDVEVNDTKEFYQGILSSVEPVIIADLIAQGYDPQELFALTMIKVDFKLAKEVAGFRRPVGAKLLSLASDLKEHSEADVLYKYDQEQLRLLFACYDFTTTDGKATDLAPISRVSGAPDKGGISLKDLAVLDGDKLDLSAPIGSAADDKIMVQRPGKQVGRFEWSGRDATCSKLEDIEKASDAATAQHRPKDPPPDLTFIGDNKLLVPVLNAQNVATDAKAEVEILATFRSPEAIIQFLGDCLKQDGTKLFCKVNGRLLFELNVGKGPDNTVTAELAGHKYFINPDDDGGKNSLRTLGVIEKLLDLHKSSTDKPSTVPVHVVS